MKYTLYIDNVFIMNLILDELLLTITCKFTGNHTTFLRRFIGATLGSLVYCLFLLCWSMSYWNFLLAEIFGVLMMNMVTLRTRKLKDFVYFSLCYFANAFFIGGFLFFVIRRMPFEMQSRNWMIILLLACVGDGLLELLLKEFRRKKNQKFCKVILNGDKGAIEVTALIDSGNGLYDPISGKTAAILTEEIWSQMSECKKEEKYKILPYSSIGKEKGMLEGYELDQIVLEERILEHMVVAIYPGNLSGRKSYQMILPTEWVL